MKIFGILKIFLDIKISKVSLFFWDFEIFFEIFKIFFEIFKIFEIFCEIFKIFFEIFFWQSDKDFFDLFAPRLKPENRTGYQLKPQNPHKKLRKNDKPRQKRAKTANK